MTYLSKETLLWAYEKLSTLSENPTLQGATQKVSAIRYFLALDMFYKQNNRECDTRNANDKAEFIKYVNRIVGIDNSFYTTNFYVPLAMHQGDCAVGSNFYSVGAVKNSLVNPSLLISYPQRGNKPLFNIQNGKLCQRTELIGNINSYINSEEHKLALALWILRGRELDSSSILTEIDRQLQSIFTNEVWQQLHPEYGTDESLQMIKFADHVQAIEKDDIDNLFGDMKNIHSQQSCSLVSLQKIFFGAPGTGKSHTIKDTTDAQPKENVFRTTFHPDSDYSTFVGCYKPTMKTRKSEGILSETDLTTKLKGIKASGVSYPCHKFAAKYWESLKDLDTTSIKRILTACEFTETMNVEISKGIAIGQEFSSTSFDDKIVYSFVPQSFTKAYIRAWQTEEPVYLVIEEINRGNCAQIFGDLFQLLDRGDNGYSEYPIKADNDLAQYLAEQFSNNSREDIPENVKSGDELVLPSNLYIWATMNTSDQSLFPIDSAFKRRWNWVYIPIDTQKEDWYIQIGGSQYSWTDFLNKANDELLTDETAEDKHLGFYFCKPTVKENENDDEPTIITQDTFVSKVLFYLWTDVFKVYGIPSSIGNNKDWSFAKFYNENGSVDVNHVKELMNKLNITDDTDTKNLKAVKFPDGEIVNNTNGSTFDTYIQCVEKIGVNKIAEVADKIKYRRSGSPVISTTKYPELISSNKYSYHQIGDLYFVKGARSSLYVKILKALNNLLDVKMEIVN